MPNRPRYAAEQPTVGFVAWGVVCLAVSLIGFWPSYFAPLTAGTYYSSSPMMPWHVMSTVLWLLLLISQPLLIRLSKVDLHRWFGLLGACVAVGVVFTGIIVQVDVMGPYAVKADRLNAVVIPFIRFTLLLGFAVCVALAIALRTRPDWHKRLILVGTFPLFQSTFDRMGANVFGMPEVRGLFALAGYLAVTVVFVIWDRWRLGYFHPVTKRVVVPLVLFYLFSPVVAGTEWWRATASHLADRD